MDANGDFVILADVMVPFTGYQIELGDVFGNPLDQDIIGGPFSAQDATGNPAINPTIGPTGIILTFNFLETVVVQPFMNGPLLVVSTTFQENTLLTIQVKSTMSDCTRA